MLTGGKFLGGLGDIRLFLFAYLLLGSFLSLHANADPFEASLSARITDVTEFRALKEEAEVMGVRAWLFGGTAAGFGHYVKWDENRKNGDSTYHASRFDYDFTNIYRSSQDVDIVIDGTPEQAARLTQRMVARFPHMQGSKNGWEVRLLRQASGAKESLLNNPNFLNQHTDSNSTGLIEVTTPAENESLVRDLRDWDNRDSQFLRDMKNQQIKYYFSDEHARTNRAAQGLNPPIFSVVRFLTKAFQFGLEITPEDRKTIKKIIDEFSPRTSLRTDYSRNWLIKNAKKLVQNSLDVERSLKELDDLGLREKLMSLDNKDHQDSLAWWMNKSALTSQPIGQGPGKTARELGLDIVAHETRTYNAFESITLSPTGRPNVFISRNSNVAGEAAIHGDGFYTRVGRVGAVGSGLTIRFRLNPEAREGSDFRVVGGDYVLIHNKSAVEIIPESLTMTPEEYFQWIVNNQIERSDLGILEKLRRRILIKTDALSASEKKAMENAVRTNLQQAKLNQFLIETWLRLPESLEHPDIFKSIFFHHDSATIRSQILQMPQWVKHFPADYVRNLLNSGLQDETVLRDILSSAVWAAHPEGFDILLNSFIRRTHDWPDDPSKMNEWDRIKRQRSKLLDKYIWNQPHWVNHPEALKISNGKTPTYERLFYRNKLARCAAITGKMIPRVATVIGIGFVFAPQIKKKFDSIVEYFRHKNKDTEPETTK